MNDMLLVLIIILMSLLGIMFAYNMFKEKQHLNKIRSQFGHSDRDALLGSQTQSVRDGKSLSHEKVSAAAPVRLKPSLVGKTPLPPPVEEPQQPVGTPIRDEPYTQADVDEIATFETMEEPVREPVSPPPLPVQPHEPPEAEPEPLFQPAASQAAVAVSPPTPSPQTGFVGEIRATFARMLGGSEPPVAEPDNVAAELPVADAAKPRPEKLLIPLRDLYNSRLPWFDERADYMAYVSLREPLELPALPRLSNRYRYQLAGCTMDGRFQIAEPIPGVQYQAFAVGLQAISRNGLAEARDLELFAQRVREFAEHMDGEMLADDPEAFLEEARPLDELCARVDQTIAIHLVSRVSILGIELRSALEDLGFQLMEDGTFGFADRGGDVKYTVVTLDGSRFTSSLLASQPYKGFSMLFDITRVPQGEGNFDQFMNLAARLSSMLNLELVDDQIQQLSTEWMKEVRTYVLGIQKEMLEADILPGSVLAQRLFA